MTLIPTQATFHGLAHDDAIEAMIRERVTWLEQYYGGLVRCRVVVDVPHRHQQSGRHFHVRIEMHVPAGSPIVVSHEPTLHARLQDADEAAHHKETEIDRVRRFAGVAIRDAFDVARRRLEDFVREQRGAVKAHDVPSHGEVAEISKGDRFGFIQTEHGRVYFHAASVLDGAFDELKVGTPVAFVEEPGDKGPQASTVRMLGKHHYVSP